MNPPASQVLLVEDDPRMPEVLAGLLHDDHITLSSARDAAAGLKLAREKHFDLILLDLGLPGVNGFELLRQLKESPETQTIPVIVLTAWNSTDGQAARIRAGGGRLPDQTLRVGRTAGAAAGGAARQTSAGRIDASQPRAAGRPRRRRSRRARQGGVPGQHEPRNPHPHERHHRHGRACCWKRP